MTEIHYGSDPDNDEEEGVYTHDFVFNPVSPYSLLMIIEWHGELVTPWKRALLRLSPNLHKLTANCGENDMVILERPSLHLTDITLNDLFWYEEAIHDFFLRLM